MHWKMPIVMLVLLVATLAGCLGGDRDADEDAEPLWVVADGDFYAGVPYDARVLDLDDLSQAVHDILPVEVMWVPSSVDGKRIHNAVFRPDTDEPTPVFINFSPYWGRTAQEGGDNFARYMIDNFVPRGYTVVLSAVRGTGHSEGCFQIGGDLELMDTFDVVEFFATQPWSNGAIAAGGKSYDSTTQNGMIAKYPHDALKGLFHVSGITDMYRYNYREGVAYGHGAIFNTYYYLQGTDEYGAGFGGVPTLQDLQAQDPESLLRIVDDVACSELPAMQAHGVGSGASGMKTDYWIERDWNRYIGDSPWAGSIFFVHGLQDWNVKPDHILPWLTELSDQVHVYAWLHQDTPINGHVYPMRTDWNLTMLRWMDQILKGIDTGILDETPFQVQASDGQWREMDVWPPRDEETVLPVGDGGVLLEAADTPFRYAGAPRITITVTPQGPDPVLSAVLYDEAPDGSRTWANEAVLRIMYHDGLEEPSPLTPGQALQVTAEFYPQDDVLEPGHKWVMVFGAAPRHSGPLPSQLESLDVDTISAVLSMHLVDPAIGLLQPGQPLGMECFAC